MTTKHEMSNAENNVEHEHLNILLFLTIEYGIYYVMGNYFCFVYVDSTSTTIEFDFIESTTKLYFYTIIKDTYLNYNDAYAFYASSDYWNEIIASVKRQEPAILRKLM